MTVSRGETVRRRLAKNHLEALAEGHGGASPRSTPNTSPAWRMCSTSMPSNLTSKQPVVCFDEAPPSFIGEARQPIPAAPGRLERFDYEYRRNGVVNLFVFLDAHRSWRRVKVTDHRTADDFAPLHARTRRCRLPGGRAHPRRPRQPLHPHRCHLRRIPTGRSAARAQAA